MGTIRITAQQYRNYEATLRRMCNKSAKRGTLQVSSDVAEKWKCTKARKQLIVALINCNGDKDTQLHVHTDRCGSCRLYGNMRTSTQDAFNQKMEIVIRHLKEGKVVIESGYYTEATMKSELKFDKQPGFNLDLSYRVRKLSAAQGQDQGGREVLHRDESSAESFDEASWPVAVHVVYAYIERI